MQGLVMSALRMTRVDPTDQVCVLLGRVLVPSQRRVPQVSPICGEPITNHRGKSIRYERSM